MRIPDIAQPAGNIIRDALNEAHELGRMPSTRERFHHGNACTQLLQQLDGAGFEIVRKGAPQEGVVRIGKNDVGRVETRVPDGSPRGLKHQFYQNAISLLRGPAPSAEVVAMALGDASPDGPEGNVWKLYDQRLKAQPMLDALDGTDQESAADLARRFDPSWCYRNDAAYRARHDQAVRDCLEASRLTYAAAEVIGHDAVSESSTRPSRPPRGSTP